MSFARYGSTYKFHPTQIPLIQEDIARRKHPLTPHAGKHEYFNGHLKLWVDVNHYAVYRPFMLDERGNPKPEWQ